MMVFSGIGTVITFLITRNPKGFMFWSKVWGYGICWGMGIRIRRTVHPELGAKGPYVFALNHQVALDIPAAGAVMPFPFGWVAKAELAKIPFLGQSIAASPSVFIDRSHPKRSIESIRIAGEKIRDGVSVAIFPEGSRSHSGSLSEFKRGAFLLAIEAQVPVVPVVILNAHELYNEKTRLVRPGVLMIRFCAPIDISGWTRKDIPKLMELVESAMTSELDEWNRSQTPSVA